MSNNATTASGPEEDGVFSFPLTIIIPAGIIIVLLIISAIIGNILTIVSFINDKKLRVVYNIYIVNLAITDLLLGSISMTFYAVYYLKTYTWPFGYHFCKIYMAIDFTLCLESVLIMILLSWDRVLLVKQGSHYLQKETKWKALIKILISWVIAFLLYSPAIIGWDLWTGQDIVEADDCDVQFAYNVAFTTSTAICEFFIPFLIISTLNAILYFEIKKRRQITPKYNGTYKKARKSNLLQMLSRNNKINQNPAVTVSNIEEKTYCNGENPPTHQSTAIERPSRNMAETLIDKVQNSTESRNSSGSNMLEVPHGIQETQSVSTNNIATSPCGNNQTENRPSNTFSSEKKNSNITQTRRDIKAAQYLAILVVVFAITWAPYTLTTMIISFCESCVNEHAYEVMNWLLWSKASVNPFLYALNSEQFRKNFRKLLCVLPMCNKQSADRDKFATQRSVTKTTRY